MIKIGGQPQPACCRHALTRCAKLLAALRSRGKARLVVVTEPGAAGKTRLVLQAAWDLVDEFFDGVLFVSLAPIANAALLALVAATLPGRRLLTTDNSEQVLEAAPAVAGLPGRRAHQPAGSQAPGDVCCQRASVKRALRRVKAISRPARRAKPGRFAFGTAARLAYDAGATWLLAAGGPIAPLTADWSTA